MIILCKELRMKENCYAQIIRDADKLDNCRVKLENPIETMLGVPEESCRNVGN